MSLMGPSSERGSSRAFPKRVMMAAGAAVAAGWVASGKWKSVAGFFGVRTEESPFYTTEFREMDFKIRRYDAHAVAEVTVEGPHDDAIKQGFMILMNYLSGENAEGAKIPMTNPVSQTEVAGAWQLSLVLPSQFDLAALPKPLNPRIRVFAVPPRRAAVVSFSGPSREADFSREAARLQNWIYRHDLKKKAAPVLNLYDPPYTIPFLKKNEVQIEID